MPNAINDIAEPHASFVQSSLQGSLGQTHLASNPVECRHAIAQLPDDDIADLIHEIVFVILAIVMIVITLVRPRTKPIEYPTSRIDTRVHPQSYIFGSLIIAATVALYIIFW